MRERARCQRGSTLVEFALVSPVLILFVFGIIDFGWLFANHQDVRHGARETARLAVVNYTTVTDPSDEAQPGGCDEGGASTWGGGSVTQTARLVCEAEVRMGSLADADTSVQITCVVAAVPTDCSAVDSGDSVRVRVCYPMRSVSGIMGPVLSGNHLRSTVEMRLEQEPTFAANWDGTGDCPASGP